MSHEVLQVDGIAKMFSVRDVPWHGLGNVIPAYPKSVEEIMEAAGYEDVAELPLTVTLPDGTVWTVDTHKAIASVPRNKVLSVMSQSYTLIPARPMVEFAFAVLNVDPATMELETLLSEDGTPPIQFETGMSLYDGRVTTLMARIPAHIEVGGVDKVNLFVGFTNSYDGSLKFGAHVTPVREVCANTLRMGMAGAKESWSVKHTKNAMNYVAEARATLKLTSKYVDAFKAEADRLISREFSKGEFETMVRDLFPKPENEAAPFSKEQYSMIGLLESSPTISDDIRYTAWGALNAVREYDDWGRRFNEESKTGSTAAERRTISALFGKGKERGDTVAKYLRELAGAAA